MFLQERIDARIQFIEVGDDGNARGARPGGGLGCCSGVVPIDVKSAGVEDPIALEFFRAQRQALVALPEDGALAGFIDEDERLLAGAGRSGEEMRLDADASKLRAMQRGRGVIADLADVARAESPLLAGHDGGGDLAAGQNCCGANFDFGAARGKVRDGNQGVNGIEADADEIDLRWVHHFV